MELHNVWDKLNLILQGFATKFVIFCFIVCLLIVFRPKYRLITDKLSALFSKCVWLFALRVKQLCIFDVAVASPKQILLLFGIAND